MLPGVLILLSVMISVTALYIGMTAFPDGMKAKCYTRLFRNQTGKLYSAFPLVLHILTVRGSIADMQTCGVLRMISGITGSFLRICSGDVSYGKLNFIKKDTIIFSLIIYNISKKSAVISTLYTVTVYISNHKKKVRVHIISATQQAAYKRLGLTLLPYC